MYLKKSAKQHEKVRRNKQIARQNEKEGTSNDKGEGVTTCTLEKVRSNMTRCEGTNK